MFTIDIILNFFLALKVKGDEADYVTHFEKIGLNYLKTNFLRDLLLTTPLGMVSYVFPKLKILYLIKAVRIERFFKFFKPSFFMPQIRKYYSKKLAVVLLDETKKNNVVESNNFIIERTRMRNNINSLRILLAILGSIYFSSIVWFLIISEQVSNTKTKKTLNEMHDQEENFASFFGLMDMPSSQTQIISAYYSFTTLSQVGFGDYYPISNIERIICSGLMFLGVAVYSFVGNNFYLMVESLQNFDKEYEES